MFSAMRVSTIRLRPLKPFDDSRIDHLANTRLSAHSSEAMRQILPKRRASEVQPANSVRFKPHDTRPRIAGERRRVMAEAPAVRITSKYTDT